MSQPLPTSPGEVSLADVLPSVASALGVRGHTDVLDLGQPQHVVCALIDGLGAQQLQRYAHLAPALASLSGPRAATMVPSTTPVALGSFGTGTMPGTHGLVGASFWVPEFDDVLIPLHWSHDMPPMAVQPEPTMLERMAGAGILVSTIAPDAYRNSGLTRAVLRGGGYEAAEDVMQRIAGVLYATAQGAASFSYVYWAEFDRVGHEFGVGSSRWRQALIRVDSLVEGLMNALPRDSALVVTADHGMVNCETRIAVDAESRFTDGVRLLAGEPRARHVYVEAGQADQVARRWAEALGDQARVVHRDELIASALMGEVLEEVADRIGDLVVLATGDVALTSSNDVRVSALLGQHGAITMDEWEIPCLVARV